MPPPPSDHDRQVVASYEQVPQFEPDGWADQEEANRSARRALPGRHGEEEGAACDPW